MSVFNLSLDDFSPHKRAGLDFKVIDRCNKLIEDFPNLKVNLFVPAAYCRLNENPCYLKDHPDWVKKVNELPKNNYCVNFHGMFHRRNQNDFDGHIGQLASNNDEWQYLDAPQASLLFSKIKIEFEQSGLVYGTNPLIFRPPGWKISREACRSLYSKNIKIAGDGRYDAGYHASATWASYNWDMTTNCKMETGDVYAFGHTSNWTNNYMDKKRYELILELLNSREFEFKFLGE